MGDHRVCPRAAAQPARDHQRCAARYAREPALMAEQSAPSTGVVRFQRPALIIGILGLAASAIGWFIDPREFFRGYLVSFVFWFSIVAGALAVLVLQYTTGGGWGLMLLRPPGRAARTTLWMALFFFPVWVWMKVLFPWVYVDW